MEYIQAIFYLSIIELEHTLIQPNPLLISVIILGFRVVWDCNCRAASHSSSLFKKWTCHQNSILQQVFRFFWSIKKMMNTAGLRKWKSNFSSDLLLLTQKNKWISIYQRMFCITAKSTLIFMTCKAISF